MENKLTMALKQEFKEMNMYIKSSWVQNAETISDNTQDYKYVYILWMSIVNTIPGLNIQCFWEKCASMTCALYTCKLYHVECWIHVLKKYHRLQCMNILCATWIQNHTEHISGSHE